MGQAQAQVLARPQVQEARPASQELVGLVVAGGHADTACVSGQVDVVLDQRAELVANGGLHPGRQLVATGLRQGEIHHATHGLLGGDVPRLELSAHLDHGVHLARIGGRLGALGRKLVGERTAGALRGFRPGGLLDVRRRRRTGTFDLHEVKCSPCAPVLPAAPPGKLRPLAAGSQAPAGAAIRTESVSKTYGRGPAAQQVLKGVTLEVARGELVALVGQSGSGKSTLLNLIGGLDRPDGGSVHVEGHDLARLGDGALSRLRNERIGFVFQSFHLLDHLSLRENVALPAFFGRPEPDEGRAAEALDRVGLARFIDRKPTALSGGQKQRVAIARAMYRRPPILLCDEPTGNLDSETGREIIDFFVELNERDGTTLLVVTHEERVSTRARRVIRIEDGLLLEEGAP